MSHAPKKERRQEPVSRKQAQEADGSPETYTRQHLLTAYCLLLNCLLLLTPASCRLPPDLVGVGIEPTSRAFQARANPSQLSDPEKLPIADFRLRFMGSHAQSWKYHSRQLVDDSDPFRLASY